MVVLVDIDDTLAPMQTALLAFINGRAERIYRYEELDESYREGHDSVYQSLVAEFLAQPKLVKQVNPYPFALDAVKSLKRAGYTVHIASSRKEPLHEVTSQWLVTHGFEPYIEDYHSRPKTQSGSQFKQTVAQRLNASVAFDDTMSVAVSLSTASVKVYLVDKPWNRRQNLPLGIVRTRNFARGVNSLIKS